MQKIFTLTQIFVSKLSLAVTELGRWESSKPVLSPLPTHHPLSGGEALHAHGSLLYQFSIFFDWFLFSYLRVPLIWKRKQKKWIFNMCSYKMQKIFTLTQIFVSKLSLAVTELGRWESSKPVLSPLPTHHPLSGGEALHAHGTPGVDASGADAHLRAQTWG